MALSRQEIQKPQRPKKVVDVPGYGEFIVQSMSLSDQLVFMDRAFSAKGDTGRAEMLRSIPEVLALCVLDPDGKPFWSAQEWQDFGSTTAQSEVCMTLYQEIQSLMSPEKKATSKARTSSRSGSASS